VQIFLYVSFFRAETLFMSNLFILRSLMNLFQHSPLDFRLGWLGLIVISPHAHRIHHLKEPRLHGKNFGTDIALWDHLFGTFQHDAPLSASEMEQNFGLSEAEGGGRCIATEMLRSTRRSLAVLFRPFRARKP
jgi:sterol desaturase/sphingolipid hydroxylase (fatty acid hydroxylase superfamily)